MADGYSFAEGFCGNPDDTTYIDGRVSGFNNMLGNYTPCFTDAAILAISHQVLIILCIYRIGKLRSALPVKTPTSTMAGYLRIIQLLVIGFAAVIWLIAILHFDDRIQHSVPKPIADYELWSAASEITAWLLFTGAALQELIGGDKRGKWGVRCSVTLVFAGNLAKMWFVVSYASDGLWSKKYYSLLLLQFILQFFVCLLTLFVPPDTWYEPKQPSESYEALDEQGVGVPLTPSDGALTDQLELPGDLRSKQFPEFEGSWWSRIMFTWVSPMIKQGYKEPLKDENIWSLAPHDRASKLLSDFEQCWQAHRNVVATLWSLHRSAFIKAGLWKLLNDGSQFVGPVFLDKLLTSSGRVGYLYAFGIFVGLAIGLLGENQYFQAMMRVGFQTRSALVGKLFKHSVFLSHSGKAASDGIEINNLISSDCESLQAVSQNLHNLWSAPCRILISMALLYAQLGPASLTALVVLCVFIPALRACIKKIAIFKRAAAKFTDGRVRVMGETVDFMHVIKCYAWEESTNDSVSDYREQELGALYTSANYSALNTTITAAIPICVSVLTFTMFSINNTLTPSKAFTSLALFGVLRMPLFTFPNLITQIASAQVSLQRIEQYLLTEETTLEPFPEQSPDEPAIEIVDGFYSWNLANEKPTLSGINLVVQPGQLVAVVGSAGFGKSSLLEAILGEMPGYGGPTFKSVLRGTVAYVPQQSWIFNATVEDNILFGCEYDEAKFELAIQVSQLERDLEILSDGKYTEIGERGVNVSGGQKQRIAIARAVYADADVYVFDDPLSALDASVGKRIFDSCINGWLAGDPNATPPRRAKTRILATNQLQYCTDVCDNIVFLGQGHIAEQGNFRSHADSHSSFYKLFSANVGEDEDTEAEVDDAAKAEDDEAEPAIAKQAKASTGRGTLMKAESRETGNLSFGVISRYADAMGGWGVLVFLIGFFIMVEVTRTGASLWMSFWSGHPNAMGVWGFLGIYASFSFLQVAFGAFQSFYLAHKGNVAARTLHSGMLHSVFRAPMAFFNTNSKGRIINRFSKDMADIDGTITMYTSVFLRGVIQLASTLALICITTPFVMTCIVPLLVVFWYIYRLFQTSAREIKRLDAVSRSPVYGIVNSVLGGGLSTVHAYRSHDRMISQLCTKIDQNIRMTLANMSGNRWLSLRLELTGGLMVLCCAMFVVEENGNTSADDTSSKSTMGLTLSYALMITSLLTMTVRLASVAENSFNAVERVAEYADLEPEAPLRVAKDQDGNTKPSAEWPKVKNTPDTDWPALGALEFNNVSMRYRQETPVVLKNFSAFIQPCEKIGVVGRTGAGKSTLFNTLFRTAEVEPDGGSIELDGVDVASIGLFDLRSRMSILPQEPVLFKGSVRYNLDPFGKCSDAEIWQALDRAHLKHMISSHTVTDSVGAKSYPKLEMAVEQGGANFSVGQRQLISLARALLRRSKVLVLDEATAAVDVETDKLIQRTIRSEFEQCTMLIIAHRINTIIDCNRVMVMDQGELIEFDTPKALLNLDPKSKRKYPNGVFESMVHDTGESLSEKLKTMVLTGDFGFDDEVALPGTGASQARSLLRNGLIDEDSGTAVPAEGVVAKVVDAMAMLREALADEQALEEGLSLLGEDIDRQVFKQEICSQVYNMSGVQLPNTKRSAMEEAMAENPMLTEWGQQLRAQVTELYELIGGTVTNSDHQAALRYRQLAQSSSADIEMVRSLQTLM